MIRHVVMLRFVPDADASQIDRYVLAVPTLRAIPGVEALAFGRNVDGRTPGIADSSMIPSSNWDFLVSAVFATYNDYQVYASHPIHRELIDTYLAGLVSDRAALQMHSAD
jgi:hypothetical protein